MQNSNLEILENTPLPSSSAAPAPKFLKGYVVKRNDRKFKNEYTFFCVVMDSEGVLYTFDQRDRPSGKADLFPGALVKFLPGSNYVTTNHTGTILSCTMISQITSPLSSRGDWPCICGKVTGSLPQRRLAVAVGWLSDTQRPDMIVHLPSLTKDSVIPNSERWVKLYAYVKIKQGKQHLQIHHMEIDEDRERKEMYLKRDFIFPPINLNAVVQLPNVFIGNFASSHEGPALVMDYYDMKQFLGNRTLASVSAGDILCWLGAKYNARKEYMMSYDTTTLSETNRALYTAELDKVSACDRTATRLMAGRVSEGMRIVINTLAMGKDQFRKGQWSPADWGK